MSNDDSRYEIDPEPEGRDQGDPPAGGFAAEVRGFWRDVKRFILKALGLGDMIGNIAVDAYRLIGDGAKLFARYGGFAALLGAAVGLTSPLSHGWGVSALSASDWGAWAPVGTLALLFLGARTVLVLFGPIERESKRQQRRQSVERPQPGVEERLQQDGGRRKALNESIKGDSISVPLDGKGTVLDVLAEAAYQLDARGQGGIALTLRRWTRKRGLKEVTTRGIIDDIVNGRLDGLGWEELVDIDQALRDALKPLGYAHAAVAFTAGCHHYVLLGLSGAPIPGHARVEISHAATRLLEAHAGGSAAQGVSAP